MAETLYIVDAHSLIFQVFHAIPEMSAPDGRPTNAVFGFTRDLLYLCETKKPSYLICAFDASGATFRDTIYPAYKANRPPMPENLRPQLEMIRQVVEALEIVSFEHAGVEADDVVATIARQATARGIDTRICTGDKDARQLIGPHVTIYNIRRDEIFDEKSLQAEWGIRPDQVVDLLAMTGDSVDNVPGIEGVGPKTASSLLQQFGTLEGVLANIDRVTGKKRQDNLRKGIDVSRRARELVELRDDVPIEVPWERARLCKRDTARVAQLFRQFGFQRLSSQFMVETPPETPWHGNYRTVASLDELRDLAAQAATRSRVAIELITTNAQPMNSKLVGISLACDAGEAWYVPIRAALGDRCLSERAVLDELRSVLESDQCRKWGHNLKHHAIVLRRAGIQLAGLGLDTMVADYLMEAGERSHSIEQLAARYLNHKLNPLQAPARPGDSLDPALIPVVDATRWAGESADVILRLSDIQEQRLREGDLWNLFETVELPLIEVLADMEYDGVFVDVDVLARLRREFAEQLAAMERKIYELAGTEFNVGSTVQLRTVLFDRLKLPVLKKTQTGPSTDQEVLEQLSRDHPLPRLLIEHRQISKLMTTYVEALPKLVNPDTGRIHATFNQVVAATGRLSSSDPNLQNIPIRTDLGRQIRQAFTARALEPEFTLSSGMAPAKSPQREPWRVLTADYSQIELRILAHLSGDTELTRAFAADEDIHNAVASQIFGVVARDITPEMRRVAKTVNFGVIYGLSPFGLAARLAISREEAEAFISAYFARYQGVSAFIRDVMARAHREGFVTTILGRRRYIAGVRNRIGQSLNQSEREAINTVVQGSAADLIKVAMIRLHQRLRREQFQSRMVLQIHDELVFEIPEHELDAVSRAVRQEMTGAISMKVPIKVDIAVGENWLDVDSVEAEPAESPESAASKSGERVAGGIVVGLVGSVCAGKSSVARRLREHGAMVYEADAIVRELYERPDVRAEVRSLLGDAVFEPSGAVNRAAIAERVFGPDGSAELRRRLTDEIIFPRTGAELNRRLAEFRAKASRGDVFLVDAPTLFEAGRDSLCDRIIWVTAPIERRREWAMSRGWATDELDRRQAALIPDETKRRHADYIIENSGSLEALNAATDRVWEQLGRHYAQRL